MINITILCVGKLKESYWVDAVKEYSKRLSKYCSLAIEELKEDRLPDNPSKAQEEQVKINEGLSVLKKVKGDSYVITLEIDGKKLSSEGFAATIDKLALSGKSHITFIIGGSLGLSQEVSNRADFKLSFSDMTFPHQMIRVFLLEQIYRAFKINCNESYHK